MDSPAATKHSELRTSFSNTQHDVVQCDKNRVQVEQTAIVTETTFSWRKCSLSFWIIIFANATCQFLGAFEMTAVSTVLPTIAQELGGGDFVWVGSAYTLAGTAVIPLCGNFVSIVGRKPILLLMIGLFALGSALAGATRSMHMLIAARAVQGFGSGGCVTVTMIIHADLVPLPQRGIIQGIVAITWALAAAIGPVTGGALASAGAWRWLFYLNLPICAVVAILEFIYLPNKPPQATFGQKIRRIDVLGGTVIIGGSVAFIVAMTWGGLHFPWTSAQVLVPLVVGLCAFAGFFAIERYFVEEPIVPWLAITNRTSLCGYCEAAIHGLVSFGAIYYIPVYFQAVKGASAVGSGVDILGMAMLMAPASMVCGATTQSFRVYRPQNVIGWSFIIVGFGILCILDTSSDRGQYIGFPVILGAGLGTVWIAAMFPVLAPLPVSYNAPALAFFMFVRTLFQTLGVAIGGAILQNALSHKLPLSFLSMLPTGVSYAYSAIPTIGSLPEPLRTEVRVAFVDSLKLLWEIMAGISGLGLLAVFLMEEVPMVTDVDEHWGLEQKETREAIPNVDPQQ